MIRSRTVTLIPAAVVLAALVALAAIATAPARRIRRAVAIITATSLGWWWDPILQPFRLAYGAMTGIVRSVTSIISGWVTGLFNALVAAVDDVVGLVMSAFNALSDLATGIWSAVTNITAHLIPTLAASLYNNIGGWVNALRNDAFAAINGARSLASFLFDNARASAAALFNSAWNAAWAWVSELRSFVTGSVLPFVSRAINAAIAPILSALGALTRFIGDQVAGVRSWVAPIVGLVNAARVWLLWLIAHPFDWFRAILEQLVARSARAYVEAFTRTIASEGDSVEQWLVRWLGVLMLTLPTVAVG